jgi:hypothetical protein
MLIAFNCCACGCLSLPAYLALLCGNGCGQVRRRDENAEALAPDDDALIILQIDAGRDRIALAALEGAQTSEIDEHHILRSRRGYDVAGLIVRGGADACATWSEAE